MLDSVDNFPSWNKITSVGDGCIDCEGDSWQVCEDCGEGADAVSLRGSDVACIVSGSAARSAASECWRWDHVDRVRKSRSVESCCRLSWKRYSSGSRWVDVEVSLGKGSCRPSWLDFAKTDFPGFEA